MTCELSPPAGVGHQEPTCDDLCTCHFSASAYLDLWLLQIWHLVSIEKILDMLTLAPLQTTASAHHKARGHVQLCHGSLRVPDKNIVS
jgi:hypothetical protein